MSTTAITPIPAPATAQAGFSLAPRNFEQALRFADIVAKTDMVPASYIGKPEKILVAMQWGHEIGMHPLQSLQNIAVINGRPTLWGDAALALVRSSPAFEAIHEETDGQTAICRVKRKGQAPVQRTFSLQDAEQAGLLDKPGPWRQYTRRMLQMRARAFALRDAFTDVLAGLSIAEEVQDSPPTPRAHPPEPLSASLSAPSSPPEYSAAAFQANLPKWQAAIASGKKTPQQIIALVQTKGLLSEEQKTHILQLAQAEPESQPESQSEPPSGPHIEDAQPKEP